MKILDKYLSKSILHPTIAIIVILSLIILTTQSLKYIDLMISHGIDASDFLYVTILLLPSLLFIITPICLFIAVLYSLIKLNSQRELNIIKCFGVDLYSISKPALRIAIAVTIIHFFISLYWMPIVNHTFKELTKQLKGNYITFFLQEKVFSHPTEYISFYIKNKISSNKFEEVFYQDNRNEDKPITFVAKKGELVKKNNRIYLNLINGNRQEINDKGELSVLYFDTLLVQLDFESPAAGERNATIQELSLNKLFFPDNHIDQKTRNRMLAEATNRLLWPCYNIILTMLAIIAILYGEYKRVGKNKRVAIFSGISAFLVILNTSLINIGANYPLVLVLSVALTFTILGLLTRFITNRGFIT